MTTVDIRLQTGPPAYRNGVQDGGLVEVPRVAHRRGVRAIEGWAVAGRLEIDESVVDDEIRIVD